jgi:hypothetical protein
MKLDNRSWPPVCFHSKPYFLICKIAGWVISPNIAIYRLCANPKITVAKVEVLTLPATTLKQGLAIPESLKQWV